MLVDFQGTIDRFLSGLSRQIREVVSTAFNKLMDVPSVSKSSKTHKRSFSTKEILDLRVGIQSEINSVFRRQLEDQKSHLSAIVRPSKYDVYDSV